MKKITLRSFALFLGTALAVSPLSACTSGSGNASADTGNAGVAEDTDSLREVNYQVNADTSVLGSDAQISDTLYGLFLEDINFAVDAGLYAELIKNRSFEYGTNAANGSMHGWVNSNKDVLSFSVIDGSADWTCLNENNPDYALLTNTSDTFEGIGNVGYLDGLAITEGAKYTASLYIKGIDGYSGSVRLALENADGTVYAEEILSGISDSWQKLSTTLVPDASVNENLRFCVEITCGSAAIDMVSLMPEDTYKGLPIRKDLGEYLEALHPSFLRFPGGCVIEGRDEESMYDWKDSIGNGLSFSINGEETVGDVAARPQGKDIWNGSTNNPYYTTYGIGFYEYFLFCEALDALPVPVLNAGMTCEVQSPKYIVYPLSSDEFKQCVQDALDLVEFCRGDTSTYWGSVRIAMGHEDPFALKYIAIGNEQWQTEYHAHYEAFVTAFEEAAATDPALYGDIELIVANGTASASTEGWDYIEDYPDSITTLVDEHYYESPNWFLNNTTRYDDYDRNAQAKVFLGEYAAQSNTLSAALAEAAYMTGLERNGDIVEMACYAPLFGNSTHNQWTPDMLFFSNDDVLATANYYVQKMFANNVGTTSLPAVLEADSDDTQADLCGATGLGSWMTSVAYDNFNVTSNESGEVLYATDFSSDSVLNDDDWNINEGDWEIKDGRLIQTNTGSPFDANTGDAIYVGDSSWSNYTLTVDAEVLGGSEGFLIPVCVKNTANHIFWNIGGWGNTVSCLQIVENNAKSGQVSGTVKNLTLKQNQIYHLKVVVDGNNIKCYIDDTLYVDYTYTTAPTFFEGSSMDENGDLILKFVNTADCATAINCSLSGISMADYDSTAVVTTLNGTDLSAENTFKEPDKLIPVDSTLKVAESFTCTVPKYSVTIIRISHK